MWKSLEFKYGAEKRGEVEITANLIMNFFKLIFKFKEVMIIIPKNTSILDQVA